MCAAGCGYFKPLEGFQHPGVGYPLPSCLLQLLPQQNSENLKSNMECRLVMVHALPSKVAVAQRISRSRSRLHFQGLLHHIIITAVTTRCCSWVIVIKALLFSTLTRKAASLGRRGWTWLLAQPLHGCCTSVWWLEVPRTDGRGASVKHRSDGVPTASLSQTHPAP